MVLTFLHTAMRMMTDMIMMTTKARTAANTATWENSAATGKKTQSIHQDEDKVVNSHRERLTKLAQILNADKTSLYKHVSNDFVKKAKVRLLFIAKV